MGWEDIYESEKPDSQGCESVKQNPAKDSNSVFNLRSDDSHKNNILSLDNVFVLNKMNRGSRAHSNNNQPLDVTVATFHPTPADLWAAQTLPLYGDAHSAVSKLHSCNVWNVPVNLLLFRASNTLPVSVCNTLQTQKCPVAAALKWLYCYSPACIMLQLNPGSCL